MSATAFPAIALLAIGGGAALGAIARWGLAVALNGLFPALPPGTLAANWIGGYLIGIALGAFAHHLPVAPEWRLFVITGFLGGLTTFSTFSAEIVEQIQAGRIGWAAAGVTAHVAGSLLLTIAGLATYEGLRRV
jgi:CrcB protein